MRPLEALENSLMGPQKSVKRVCLGGDSSGSPGRSAPDFMIKKNRNCVAINRNFISTLPLHSAS